jgi:hypothetical protein
LKSSRREYERAKERERKREQAQKNTRIRRENTMRKMQMNELLYIMKIFKQVAYYICSVHKCVVFSFCINFT